MRAKTNDANRQVRHKMKEYLNYHNYDIDDESLEEIDQESDSVEVYKQVIIKLKK